MTASPFVLTITLTIAFKGSTVAPSGYAVSTGRPFRAVRSVYKRAHWLLGALKDLRFSLLRALYYRFLFGRKGFLDARASDIVSAAERARHKGDVPASEDAWDSQYLSGDWAYLAGAGEAARYSVIVEYLRSLKPGGSILDVGCGEGILRERLRPYDYSRYVGIDISKVALAKASHMADERTVFVRADATMYTPTEAFDAIVFNETLYYLSEPAEVFRRYRRFLKPDGILVTSLYRGSIRANSIRRQLKARHAAVSETTRAAGPQSWTCTVFQAENVQVTRDDVPSRPVER